MTVPDCTIIRKRIPARRLRYGAQKAARLFFTEKHTAVFADNIKFHFAGYNFQQTVCIIQFDPFANSDFLCHKSETILNNSV